MYLIILIVLTIASLITKFDDWLNGKKQPLKFNIVFQKNNQIHWHLYRNE